MDLFSPMLVTKAVVTRSGATCHKSPVRPSCSQTRNDERSCPDNIHRTSQLLTAGYCLPKHLNGKGETSEEFDVKPEFFLASSLCLDNNMLLWWCLHRAEAPLPPPSAYECPHCPRCPRRVRGRRRHGRVYCDCGARRLPAGPGSS